MARARNIKPSFFTNDQLAECEPLARILFAGLWCIADREGRLQDRPKRIKIELLPYDSCDVGQLLSQLDINGLIKRYSIDGECFIQIINFTKHQDPHYKEKPSDIPAPEGHQDSGATGGGVAEEVRQEIFNRDGRSCVECGSTSDLSLDHVIPRSKGGSHDKDNLRTLCRRCNSAKNNRLSKALLEESSVNDRSIIDQSSVHQPGGKPPLIPDSLLLIPDSLQPDPGLPSTAMSPQAAPAKQGAQLPADWVLPKSWGEWAMQHRPDLTIERVREIADQFKDHWRANANQRNAKKSDWEASWRNWVRREKEQFKTAGQRRADSLDKAVHEFLGGNGSDVIEGEFVNA